MEEKKSSDRVVILVASITVGIVLLGMIIVTVLFTAVNGAATRNIPSTALKFGDNYYQLYDNSMTWTQAEKYCESLGGHLATITTADENNFIKELIVNQGNKKTYWLGASDAEKEGAWKWVTGERFLFSDWENGDPNNDRRKTDEGEDYLEIVSSLRWNDGEEDGDGAGNYALNNHGFICEWDGKSTKGYLLKTETCLTSVKCTEFTRYTENLGDSNFTALDGSYTLHDSGTFYGFTNTGVDGTQYSDGFCVWIARWNFGDKISWAQAKFALNGKYKTLRGSSALLQSNNTSDFDTSVYFYNGDILLYTFAMKPEKTDFSFTIDVTGTDELTILVKDNKETAGGTSFALYDLFLI